MLKADDKEDGTRVMPFMPPLGMGRRGFRVAVVPAPARVAAAQSVGNLPTRLWQSRVALRELLQTLHFQEGFLLPGERGGG